MASENIDMITKRPRTSHDQYTCMTEEQIHNNAINGRPNMFFMPPKPLVMSNKRYYMDRYATNTSQYLFREQPRSYPKCWIGDLWQQQPPEQHNTCRLGASLRWGPEKNGSRTYSHFVGEDTHRYLNVDVYCRPPTNLVGLVVQKHGRPGRSYYDQRHPHTVTWFGSSHILNQTDILQDIRPKTLKEHQMKSEAEKTKVIWKHGKWPEFSEYVDRYTLRAKDEPELTPLERKKRHILEAN